jgi:SAM-dependent methyltransferase
MDIQNMTFENDSFDCAVSTCVFCTVPDPIAGLKEVYRVLKPGGKVLFLEHMRSRNPLVNIILFMMTIMSKLILGTSMVRKTQENIESVGFKITERRDLFFDVVRIIIAEKTL